MRLATYLLLGLLGLAALALTAAPASATVQGPPPIQAGIDPPGTGMTCCYG